MSSTTQRSLPLDVLRGIAVTLVLFRHRELFAWTQYMGWIGVDLFFVLSGFLVSGLLFKEYKAHGTIAPVRFLVRRGFKIYPTFYMLLGFMVWLKYAIGEFSWIGLASEAVFLQNYVWGFGWWGVTWSLAVEEHFYFSLTFMLYWLMRTGRFQRDNGKWFLRGLLVMMVCCQILRIITNRWFTVVHGIPMDLANFTMTHLRYDSLLAGVLIAYYHHFRPEALQRFGHRFRHWLVPTCIALASFSPFLYAIRSPFVKTYGFTLLYVGFGLLLIHVLVNVRSMGNGVMARWFGMVGKASYSIYLIHAFTATIMEQWICPRPEGFAVYWSFALYFASSIAIGWLVFAGWESVFLRMRERWFPSRSLAPTPIMPPI